MEGRLHRNLGRGVLGFSRLHCDAERGPEPGAQPNLFGEVRAAVEKHSSAVGVSGVGEEGGCRPGSPGIERKLARVEPEGG